MKGLLLAALAVTAMVFGYAEDVLNKQPTSFELVCEKIEEVYGAQCGDLPPPQVIISKVTAFLGAIGLYIGGEKYIFIHPDARNPWDVQVHETIHYVLWELDLAKNSCDSEAVARKLAHEITKVPYDDTWWERYQCPRP